METPTRTRPTWRSVAMPTEHGGWGLTAEPVLLGLLVAPGLAGAAVGVATLLAFVARTPLKVVLVDRYRRRDLPRTALARRVFAVEAVALVVALGLAAFTAEGPFWIPIALACPLIAVELAYDARSRSRRLLPELAGAIGIGASAAAIVLADGGTWQTAAGVWTVLVARVVASIPFVRHQLDRVKHHSTDRRASDGCQLLAVALVVGALAAGWVPVAAVAVIAALGLAQVALARVPPPKATVLGVQQTVLGLVVVIVTAIAI